MGKTQNKNINWKKISQKWVTGCYTQNQFNGYI